jgi:hypothetical protein
MLDTGANVSSLDKIKTHPVDSYQGTREQRKLLFKLEGGF